MPTQRVRDVSQGAYRVYLRKARSFADIVPWGMARRNPNAAALGAIHSVISACDAMTSFYLGERSSSQDHEESIELLSLLRVPGTAERKAQVAEALRLKRKVEYESREPIPEEVERLALLSKRVLKWASENLPDT